MRWLAIWFASLLFWAAPARAEVSYQIDLSQRASHVAIIEMTVRGSHAPLDLWMPAWTPWDAEKRATMVFGAGSAKVVNDPGKDERLAIKAVRDAQQPRSSAE